MCPQAMAVLAALQPQRQELQELAVLQVRLLMAMAVQAAQDAGIASACHIHGGLDAWRKVNGPLVR